MVSCQNDLPWTWGSIYVTILTVSLLKMVLKGGRQVKALEAEGADEPLLRRVPILTVLSCAGRWVRHWLCLVRNVLQEIHVCGRSGNHSLFGSQDVIAAGCGGAPPPCVVHFHRKVTGGRWELGGVLSGAAEEAGSWKSAGSWHESEKTFEEVE